MDRTIMLKLGFLVYIFFTLIRSLRYVHMFQLNSYMPERLWRWFKRSYKDEYNILSFLHLLLYPLLVFMQNIFSRTSRVLFVWLYLSI